MVVSAVCSSCIIARLHDLSTKAVTAPSSCLSLGMPHAGKPVDQHTVANCVFPALLHAAVYLSGHDPLTGASTFNLNTPAMCDSPNAGAILTTP